MNSLRPLLRRAFAFCLAVFISVAGVVVREAGAQAPVAGDTWRITLIRVTATIGGSTYTLCENQSFVVVVPAAGSTPSVGVCVNGVRASVTFMTRSIGIGFAGTGIRVENCTWDLQSVAGLGFISGDAVPASAIDGSARANPENLNCRNGAAIGGSFQAIRIGGAAPPAPPAPPAPVSPNPNIASFVGVIVITPPVGPSYQVTQGNQGTALVPGTLVAVGSTGNVTLQFPNGNLYLGANANFTVAAQRFFLLRPAIVPIRPAFMRITWRCIPGVFPCASLATPNTRLAFLPQSQLAPLGRSRGADTTDVAFTVNYTQTFAGLGSSDVAVQTGTIEVADLVGRIVRLSAGQQQTFTTFVAGAAPLNLNGDSVSDLLTYHQASGTWTQMLGGTRSGTTGRWLAGATVTPVDFNGDGRTDFHLERAGISWMVAVNNGIGDFVVDNGSLQPDEHTHLLNLNGDRMTDVLVHTNSTGRYWAGMNVDGGWEFLGFEGHWAVGFEAYPLKINDDDFVDVLLFNATTGQWSTQIGNGRAQFASHASGTWSGATHVFPGDFNADGRWDVLCYNSRNSGWWMARNTGTALTVQRSGNWSANLTIATGDVDADGDTDAVTYDPGSGRWSIQISEPAADGTHRFSSGPAGSWSPQWELTPADFNSDDRLDLLLYYPAAGTWAKATNTGAGFSLEEGRWDPGLSVLASLKLASGMLTNDAANEPCASEADLRSPGGDANQIMTFVNNSQEPRKLYKVLGSGQRQETATIAPGWEELVSTARLQPWVVTDSGGRCLGIYLPAESATASYWPTMVFVQ